MSFLRTTFAVSALLLAGAATATDIDMAGGSVRFHTPDPWVGIMETQGDPEVRVFQVPDSSPTGTTALARVTVTVKQVATSAPTTSPIPPRKTAPSSPTSSATGSRKAGPSSCAACAPRRASPVRHGRRHSTRVATTLPRS